MRRRLTSTSTPEFHGVNVTPLIDVVMCLIVFFLIVGKLAHDQVAGLRLPTTAFGQTADPRSMVVISIAPAKPGDEGAARWGSEASPAIVSIRAAGQFSPSAVKDEAALEAAIRDAFKSIDPASPNSAPVQVRADRNAPFGLVEPVLRVCQRMGLTSVLLVTERAS